MLRKMQRILIVLTTIVCVSQVQVFGQSGSNNKAQENKAGDILQVAKANPQLSTFVQAIQATGLEKTFSLDTKQTLTVFAPSNAAFDSLPSGAKEDLLKPENKAKLKEILLNHMVYGKYTSADLSNDQNLQTIGGKEIGISKLGGKIMAGGKDVNKADIAASNGVIHIINMVIVPPVEEADADKE